MNFSKDNNKSIIDEIYDSKREDYEHYIECKNSENNYYSEIDDALEAIQNLCKQDINKETSGLIKEHCRRLDRAISYELDYCQKNFYKIGFINGMRMSEDIKSETKFEEE